MDADRDGFEAKAETPKLRGQRYRSAVEPALSEVEAFSGRERSWNLAEAKQGEAEP